MPKNADTPDAVDEVVEEAAPAPALPQDYPLGRFVGFGVEECVVGDLGTFKVDPETGVILAAA
jgi:hypothetical protein